MAQEGDNSAEWIEVYGPPTTVNAISERASQDTVSPSHSPNIEGNDRVSFEKPSLSAGLASLQQPPAVKGRGSQRSAGLSGTTMSGSEVYILSIHPLCRSLTSTSRDLSLMLSISGLI
jgi:hypothetical protein